MGDLFDQLSKALQEFHEIEEFNLSLKNNLEEACIHYGILCDNCDDIIVGIRYKCLYCENYDLCEDCEKQRLHSFHPMLRLAKPSTPKDIISQEQKAINQALANQTSQNIQRQCEQQKMHQKQVEKLLESHERKIKEIRGQQVLELKLLVDRIKALKKDIKMYEQQQILIMENILLPQKIFMEYLKEKPLQPIMARKDVDLAISNARREHGLDVENYYNYGFAGHTKTGKSSLINSIRGLRSIDKGAAEIDFTECTQNVTCYEAKTNPKLKRARFYDIPGCGTISHESKSYFRDKGLCAFDCLVIMIDKTIGEDEVSLARAAHHYGQGVVFVRSKCDIDLDSSKDELDIDIITPSEMSTYLNKVRNAISNEIETKCPDLNRIPCYFISAPTLREYVLGKKQTYIFQENLFIEYLILKSKHSRNIV